MGDETVLRTCTSDGGALVVQNGCCTQTSGHLAHICGEPEQVALRVEKGRVQMDPNEALSDSSSVGVSIVSSTVQTNGKLVDITGTADQTALSVQNGKTCLVSNSMNGNALHVSNNSSGQTGGSLVEIDGTGQTGGALLDIHGVQQKDALIVSGGEAHIDPQSVTGHALTITNSSSHTNEVLMDIIANSSTGGALGIRNEVEQSVSDGALVHIDGTSGGQTGGSLLEIAGLTDETALQIYDGKLNIHHGCMEVKGIEATSALVVDGGETYLNPQSGNGDALHVSNSELHNNQTLVHIVAHSETGGALDIRNDTNQTSGTLVNITGSSSEVALQVSEGTTVLDANASSANTLVVQNSSTQDSSSKMMHIIGQSNKMALQVDDGLVQLDHVTSEDASFSGGSINNMSIGETNPSTGYFTTLQANAGLDDTVIGANQPAAGTFTTLDVTQSMTLANGLIVTPDSSAPTTTTPGVHGELRIFDQTLYLFHHSAGWTKTEFTPI